VRLRARAVCVVPDARRKVTQSDTARAGFKEPSARPVERSDVDDVVEFARRYNVKFVVQKCKCLDGSFVKLDGTPLGVVAHGGLFEWRSVVVSARRMLGNLSLERGARVLFLEITGRIRLG
jgi:hypothetical protein